MTIASEISRLQQAKSDIKTAIEEKGVSVGSSDTLDDYAGCINSIPTGTPGVCGIIDYIIVGGGGGASGGVCYDSYSKGHGGGGGGGEVIIGSRVALDSNSTNIIIGNGGSGGTWVKSGQSNGCPGGNSCLGTIVAKGGCGGCGYTGGASGHKYSGTKIYSCMNGRTSYGGGGGAGGNSFCCRFNCYCERHDGGVGCCGYGGGGAGAGGPQSCVYDGGGVPQSNGGKATGYGGGGASGGCGPYNGGAGCQGIIKICYPTDGSYGIKCATGGTKSTSGKYTVHTFTSNGTFCIIC